jgi:hypothetical protein
LDWDTASAAGALGLSAPPVRIMALKASAEMVMVVSFLMRMRAGRLRGRGR